MEKSFKPVTPRTIRITSISITWSKRMDRTLSLACRSWIWTCPTDLSKI
jgi:hypothetical protein